MMDGDTPRRIQLRRTKGWRMPANTVSVAWPGRFGNPFKVGVHGDAAECVRLFAKRMTPYRHGGSLIDYYISEANVEEVERDLVGKNLACWCPLCVKHAAGKPFNKPCADCAPCHADVLLELANAPETKP